jgi:hypothetical protein
MPVQYVIDEDANVVTVTAVGSVTKEEDLDCFRTLFVDAAYRPGMGLLLDYRKRQSVATTDEVKQYVEAGATLRERFGDSRCAVVVSEDVAFGMARMHSMLAEENSIPTNAFRDIEAAMRWLTGEARKPEA